MQRESSVAAGRGLWLTLITWSVIAFLYLPIIILVIYSFNHSRFGVSWDHFSLRWYKVLFSDRSLWAAVSNSLIIATASSTVSTVLGTLAALYLDRRSTRIRHFMHGLLYLPMIIPDIVIAVSMLMFFVFIHFSLGLLSVTVAHITFSLSYVTLVVLTRLASMNRHLEEASMDLGATPVQTFFRVTLPSIYPAVLAGFLLAFMMSIDDFIVTFFTSGVGSTTLPLKIYSMIKFSVTPEINAISTILLLFTVFILILVQTLLSRGRQRNNLESTVDINPKEGLL